MPHWPHSLPRFVAGVTLAANANLAPAGERIPEEARRRFTGWGGTEPLSIVVDNAQRDIFRAFWRDEIKQGALPFDAIEPVFCEPVKMVLTDAPAYMRMSGQKTRIELRVRIFAA